MKEINFGILIIVVFVLLIGYVLGLLTVQLRLFPYPYMIEFKNSLKKSDKDIYKKNIQFLNNVDLYKIYKSEQADIIMLGDSLTDNVNWNELFNLPIINRGIGADITEGYLHRMEFIYKLKPKKVFLNGGTNDIAFDYSVEEIFSNYKEIMRLLKEKNITVYMQSVVFTSFSEYNIKIKKLNELLEVYCKENNIIYIDLNKKLSKNDTLIEEYTYDGSHLTAKGYFVWREMIQEYVLNK